MDGKHVPYAACVAHCGSLRPIAVAIYECGIVFCCTLSWAFAHAYRSQYMPPPSWVEYQACFLTIGKAGGGRVVGSLTVDDFVCVEN